VNTRTFALILGVAFLLAGIAGFFPAPLPPDAPPLTMDHGYGLALGMLPVNTLHNVVHLLFGVLGLAAYGGAFSARLYAQVVAVSYLLLAILGLLPATNTTFGLIPIYGADVALHGVIGLAAAYFGFGAPAGVTQRA
jgi:hypothetical protein